jgi:hypothetical protein
MGSARSWETKHKPKLKTILGKVKEWNADYIVPVGRKSAKLFRTLGKMDEELFPRVFYREYFKFMDASTDGKKVAVIDDVARTCSTLADYRDFFEKRGAKVRTFALAGHEKLKIDSKASYDQFSEIEDYVSEPAYRDFLIGEAEYLLREGFYQDVNHLTLELEIPQLRKGSRLSMREILEPHGYIYTVRSTNAHSQKWSIMDPDFCGESPLLSDLKGITKLRFHGTRGRIFCVPMVLPDLRIDGRCQLANIETPFQLPCQFVSKAGHEMSELCYWSISLLLSAELGRLFLRFLVNHSCIESDNRSVYRNLEVRPIDFYRYFGIELGTKLQRDIKAFLLRKDFEPSASLTGYLKKVLTPRSMEMLTGSFSEEAIAKVLDHLREEYRKACQAAGTRKGVAYPITIDKMQEISGANRLLLIESLDSLCDTGILVPVTQVTSGTIKRTWRTGENEDVVPWKRTHVLIPLAIKVVAEELGENQPIVNSLLLMKTLANFVYDYPSKGALVERMHVLVREPDIHGTVVKAYHPIRAPNPVSLYQWSRLGNRYTVYQKRLAKTNKSRGTKRVWFRALDNALKDLSEHFDNSQEVPLDEIINYLAFLAKLSKETGSADILTALSICRNPETFYWHIYKNLTLWSENYGIFLDQLQLPYTEDIRRGNLHRSGEIVNAGLKKIRLWNEFDKYLKLIEQKAQQTRFAAPRAKLLSNISKNRELEIVPDVTRILALQRALTGITLAKLLPKTIDRTQREIEEWANNEFKQHGYSFDTRSLFEAEETEVIKKILGSAYFEICYYIEMLRDPIPESERERNKADYLKAAHNRAVEVCRKAGWSLATFVHWDLTDTRRQGEGIIGKNATLYEYADNLADKYGGKLITLHPNGNDFMLCAFSNPVAALRVAAISMRDLSNASIEVKEGIAHGIAEPGTEYSNLIPAMGLAKDLCEFKDLVIGFRNKMDILVSSELVDLAQANGISRNYFLQIEGISVEHRIGNETKRLPILKFDWKRFNDDRR